MAENDDRLREQQDAGADAAAQNQPPSEPPEETSFADLLDSYTQGMHDDVQVGEKITGPIIAIGQDSVFVDTGTKIDGAVDRSELLDEDGALPYRVGDVLELYVVAMNENEIRLSRALSGVGGLNMLQDAHASRIPVEGTVQETCKGGFRVEVMQRRAFCPVSQIDVTYVEDPEVYVGQSFEFLVTRIEQNGRNIVLSRRQLLAQQQAQAQAEFLKDLAVGQIVEGPVTRLTPFGAFVELAPGLEGMVHVSELSWARVEKPEEAVSEGQVLTVKVIRIETHEKSGRPKIALSVKQTGGDPWETERERFTTGMKIQGRVTRCAGFGAFVEIAGGIEGLVHISEMSYTRRVMKPEEVVTPGQTVDVLVKEIDWAKRRISLSIRDAEGDPWIGIAERYRVGQAVDGQIEKKEAFGYFITLEPGVTGLLPKSKIAQSADPAAIEKIPAGGLVTVVVEAVQPEERKITLGPGDAREASDWKNYASGGQDALGSLGHKLQEALQAQQRKKR